ncbi:bifunctional metallophosphatase/5'-nucleotidase [Clostridium manihotivorum]|uniref:Bifunctional metallophosphatase/5'-nucleotidase n=1 Tax=Clostridium manihotivorum TaxID=2320868 RepID=A0A3R5U2W1_9CLOT|nr:bifunctional UDP-sugar hydrolase/5'-nucleotidase [Clostridium manihotivorum]QAA30237.1 bifunctional metallophosphatase/5'-nucleotidase [Clostridium manihotivorum]
MNIDNSNITILHTSDIHGNLLPIYYGTNEHRDIGLCKLSTIIKKEKEQNPNTLLIDCGDALQGSPLIYYYARINSQGINPVIKLFNHLGYDSFTVGNHEFNYGMDYLLQAKNQSKFPWITSNIISKSNGQPYFDKPYIIREYSNGLKVGVLGCTTKYIPNWEQPHIIKDLDFEDVIDSLNYWVPKVKADGADIVIVAYHGGFERDVETGIPTENLTGENQGYEICEKVKDIDVLLTGHQHRTIFNRYINNVLVCQSGFDGASIGKVSLSLGFKDSKWHIISVSNEMLYSKDYDEDVDCLELVKEYEINTQAWLDTPIGKINGDMTVSDPLKIRLQDNSLMEFINKVQMYFGETDISLTSLFDNRSPGLKTNVTMRDVVSNYIYPNTLKVLKLKGLDIKLALERSASYFEYIDGEYTVSKEFANPKPQHYNYDMWEGINYIINVSKPIGDRVISLKYKNTDLDMNKEYNVVMNNYRASGGGDYLMFKDKPLVKDIPTDVSELIANYILERKVIDATVNNNWKVIHD